MMKVQIKRERERKLVRGRFHLVRFSECCERDCVCLFGGGGREQKGQSTFFSALRRQVCEKAIPPFGLFFLRKYCMSCGKTGKHVCSSVKLSSEQELRRS